MTINLGLIFETTRTQKQFPLSVFVFIGSLGFLDKITSSCIWVAIPVYIGMSVVTTDDGRCTVT